jgi:hypothetical protein
MVKIRRKLYYSLYHRLQNITQESEAANFVPTTQRAAGHFALNRRKLQHSLCCLTQKKAAKLVFNHQKILEGSFAMASRVVLYIYYNMWHKSTH